MKWGWIGVLCLFAGCASDQVELSIELQTDLVAGVEFSSVTLALEPNIEREAIVSRSDDFLPAKRVADFAQLSASASRFVTVTLLDNTGSTVASSTVVVDNRQDATVVLTVSRACVGVVCPADNPSETACLAGNCVLPTCILGNEPGCPEPECGSASECAASPQACLGVMCVAGSCIYPENDVCIEPQYCSVASGCVVADACLSVSCDDGNECTDNSCSEGNCSSSNVEDGTSCTTGACRGGVCEANVGTCTDGLLNQDETDVDCGGVCPECLPSICASVQTMDTAECVALVRLYESTDGPNWITSDGWTVDPNPCAWEGVFCVGGHVDQLLLTSHNLSGTLPTEIGALRWVTDLELTENALRGVLPASIGGMSDLEQLMLSDNQLTGPIPLNIAGLTSLVFMYLDGNRLSGAIPDSLTTMTTLRDVFLCPNAGLSSTSAVDAFIRSKNTDWNNGCP